MTPPSRKRRFFLPVACCLLCIRLSAQNMPAIRLNQAGFYPRGPKTAVIENKSDVPFYLIRLSSKDTVFRGVSAGHYLSRFSSLFTSVADFSSFTTPGVYCLYVPGAGDSYPFSVSNSAYHNVAKGVLKAYYFLRCSERLLPRYAGKWARAEGHPDTAVLVHPSAASAERPAGTRISSPGGWYDAGDYNKYIVNCGITMGTLLSLYEDFPGYCDTLYTHIPESHDHIPDLLNEVLWNLRWMLTMQDRPVRRRRIS